MGDEFYKNHLNSKPQKEGGAKIAHGTTKCHGGDDKMSWGDDKMSCRSDISSLYNNNSTPKGVCDRCEQSQRVDKPCVIAKTQESFNQSCISEDKEISDVTNKSLHKVKRFIAPDPAEVTEYAKTIDFKLDGEEFCDYYESVGWMVGRKPMRSWKAAVRTWKMRKAPADKPSRYKTIEEMQEEGLL